MHNIIIPHHIHYLVLDPDLAIISRSQGVGQFVDDFDAIEIGQNIQEGFPELFGCEEILAEILVGERESFALQGITRQGDRETNLYIDLYFQHYGQIENKKNLLILFVEDVTEKMTLEQTLVQSTNETKLLNSALTASRNYINRIVTSIADALIVTDTQQIIKTVNGATERLFGYAKKDLIEQHLSLLIIEEGDLIFSPLQETIAREGELTCNIEVSCRTKTDSKIDVAFSCSLIQVEAETEAQDLTLTPEIVYIGRDITERKRTQQRLTAQYAIAHILSESSSLETDTQPILKAIGEILGWDVGELWQPIPEEGNKTITANFTTTAPLDRTELSPHSGLRRMDLWTNPEAIVTEFINVTGTVVLQAGIGLAGRVWERGYPQWIADLSGDTDFGFNSSAARSGLRSAFAFPIQSGNEMLGVMSFFGREKLPPDENLLQMMAAMGNQLGQFVKRKQAEAALQKQQEKSERLLLNILPKSIADRLKEEQTIADSFDEVTVLFADLVGFTEMSAHLSPIEVVEQLNGIFSEFDRLTEKYKLEKIKTIGDAYMVVGGLPEVRVDHAAIIADMALEMQAAIVKINKTTQQNFAIRVGINTGSVVAGVIGTKKFIYDLWGDTVNTASRMESHGKPGQIQVTENTYKILRDRYEFEDKGLIPVKGKGEMKVFWLMRKK